MLYDWYHVNECMGRRFRGRKEKKMNNSVTRIDTLMLTFETGVTPKSLYEDYIQVCFSFGANILLFDTQNTILIHLIQTNY